METNKNSPQQPQQGSGSSENQGQDRSQQLHNNPDLSDEERQNLAEEIGERPAMVAGLKDMGAISGRDDTAGGSGDRMEEESSGGETDRGS